MQDASLEIQLTPGNNDTITGIAAFYLKNIDRSKMSNTLDQSFKNIKSTDHNKFIIKHVISGIYFGLIQVEHKGSTYNLIIDSLLIRPGENFVTKEIKLGMSEQ